jgi:hypothetical protein
MGRLSGRRVFGRFWLVAALLVASRAQAQGTPLLPATLAGTIRDSLGKPIPDAEIVIPEISRGVRTNSDGQFVLTGISPGRYDVWFRRLGYESARFNWAARTDERVDVAVTLHMIPRRLKPMVVRANEDKRMRGRASILGVVVDSTGAPIEEAEVQLVGANRTAVTRPNGGFLLTGLPVGPYVIRVRKIGFAPNVLHIELQDGEEREVAIKIRSLVRVLDAMQVNEESGYGRDQVAWDELEKRRRWQSFRDVVLGPEELKRWYSLPLDMATRGMLGGPTAPRAVTSFGHTQRAEAADPNADDACILLNGITAIRQPLRVYGANDLDLIEIYPPGGDLSGTIGARMSGVRGCEPNGLGRTPTYYVLWLKGHR